MSGGTSGAMSGPTSGPTSMPARGRRRGRPDTRAAILAAAREQFSASGFSGTSVRAVARGAGVDPALVHHYFGTKDQLFAASLELPMDPTLIAPALLADGLDGLGERLVRTFLGIWDDIRRLFAATPDAQGRFSIPLSFTDPAISGRRFTRSSSVTSRRTTAPKSRRRKRLPILHRPSRPPLARVKASRAASPTAADRI